MSLRPPALLRHAVFPLLVLLVGLLATAVFTIVLRRAIDARDADRFGAAADALHDSITQRVDAYVAMLRAGSGLFTGPALPGADAFATFVERLELDEEYPGVQGIGFAARVRPADVPRVVAGRVADGTTDFRVWPDHTRDEYYPILYLEPMDRRNRAALGYDMFTEPTRQEAMVRARDTGRPAASGAVTLVQEIDEHKQAGFLIYLPVYDSRQPPSSADARRQRLRGFVYSPFRAGDLLEGILGRHPRPRVAFRLHDGEDTSGPLLFETPQPESARFTTIRRLEIAGRPWSALVVSTPALDDSSTVGLVPYAALAGSLMTLTLTWLAVLQARARWRAERSEAAAEEATRRLVEQASLKDQFLATLSHELRTPMNAIVGWAQMLASENLDERLHRQAVESITRNAGLQSQLIEDLLDMSRIMSGRVRLEVGALDLHDVLQAAADVVRPTAAARGVTLTVLSGPGAMVMGDPTRLQQVAWNLLSNAIKFTPAGGSVSAWLQQGEHVTLTVRDTGVGIEPAFLPHVFDRFRQADGTSTRRHGGLGLGLAIVRSLVEMHGGEVRGESDGPGRGSTFVVTLPRAAATAPADGSPGVAPAPAPRATPRALERVRILVVDDDQDGRALAAAILTQAGAVVTTAASAQVALEMLDAQAPWPDVIVSDLGMPGMDGYAFVQDVRLRERDRGGRCIGAVALTAYAGLVERSRASEAGYDAHVAKPFQPADLVTRCQQVMPHTR